MTKRRPLAHLPRSGPRIVEVMDTEEEGSDVNLTSYLLLDGFDDEYQLAVVISNVSDIESLNRKALTRLGRQVGFSTQADDEASSCTVQRPGVGCFVETLAIRPMTLKL